MKTQQYFAGVLLIALLVAGAILTGAAQLSRLLEPAPQADVATGQLPSAGDLPIDRPMVGKVELLYTGPGSFYEGIEPPSPEELAELPDLGEFNLGLLLDQQNLQVSGYVELETSLVFTGYHTINTTLGGTPTTLTVGPFVDGLYDQGVLSVMSEPFSYVTDSGETLERQFWMNGQPSDTPGVVVGDYYETIWGFGDDVVTIVGTFELKDLAITTVAANRAPVAAPLALVTAHNTAVAATLDAVDPEGLPLTYSIVAPPVNGTLSGSAPNLTYTPNNGFAGKDSFTFKASDGSLESAPTNVIIDVEPSLTGNRNPVANAQTVAAVTAQAKSITLTGSDADNDALTFTIVTPPANGTLSGTAPNVSYTSNAGFVGADIFTFKVNDGSVDSAVATVTVNVTAPGNGDNTAPSANSQSVTTIREQTIAVTLQGTDEDGDTLSFVIVDQPTNGELSGTPPNMSYTPNAGFVGTDSFTFKVNDGSVDSAVATVTVTVTPPGNGDNTAPDADAQSVTTRQGQNVEITLQGVDSDGDTLTFIIVDQPTNGTLSGTAPNLTYTPNEGFVGTDSFTYKVNDGTVDSSTVAVTVVVEAGEPVDEEDRIYLPVTKK